VGEDTSVTKASVDAGSIGLAVAGLQIQRELKLEGKGAEEIIKASGLSRSQAYRVAGEVRAYADHRPGPGRPHKAAGAEPAEWWRTRAAVSDALRDWVYDHPGAVCRVDERMRYTDAFRAFVLDLVAPGGLAGDLTHEQAAAALGIPKTTFLGWLSSGRLPKPAEPAQSSPAAAGEAATSSSPPLDAPPPELAGSPATVACAAAGVPEEVAGAVPVEPPSGQPPAAAPEDTTPPAVEVCASQPAAGPPRPETQDATAAVMVPAHATTTVDDAVRLPGSEWAVIAAQVLSLWELWEGNLVAFHRSLPSHGIHWSPALLRTILNLGAGRKGRSRRRRHPDPEAIRGELERFFANAQWHADGKGVVIQFGDRCYRFNWELIVDNMTTALLGMSLRDNEDSSGLIEALKHAKVTAGAAAEGLLRDPRKCNTAAPVEEFLDKEGMVSMFSGVGRPQTNSPCETEFSLFTQKMIDLFFPDGLTEKQLACRVLQYILYAYCAGRNFTPRKRLHHKTPAQAYADTRVPDEEKARVKEVLKDLARRVQEEAAADRRRCAPATLQLLTDSFPDLGLADPKDRYIPSAAAYGLDAATEAIAIFKAKKEAGTLPEDHLERYFLGITRNVAFRNEDQLTYERLLDLRAKAGDLVLRPLVEHDASLRNSLSAAAYRAATLDLALSSPANVDRVFWRRQLLVAFDQLPLAERPEAGRWFARRIANQTHIHHRERDHFISLVARTAVPLAA
jgi:transposase InsO family protein